MNVAQETLGFRRAGFSPALSLLMSAFALPMPPARVTPHLLRPTERSPTTCAIPSARSHSDSTYTKSHFNELRWIAHIHSFGAWFEPRYIFRAGRLDQ